MNKKQQPSKFIKRCKTSLKQSRVNLIIPKNEHMKYKSSQLLKKPPKNTQQINKNQLQYFSVIGMVRKQIFCIYNNKMQLFATIDQHAMHQRIRYEYFCRKIQNIDVSSFCQRNIQKNQNKHKDNKLIMIKKKNQKLIFICQINSGLIYQNKIVQFGFQLNIIDFSKVYLINYQQNIVKITQKDVLIQICKQIVQLNINKQNKIPKTLDNMLAETACKSAIKFGDSITQEWCRDLIYNASLCQFPWKCVHGRTTTHFKNYNIINVRKYELS